MKYTPVNYQQYLQLDKVVNAQSLLSEKYNNTAHDEMLFIIVHQTYELWFKQILFELDSVIKTFSQTRIPESEMSSTVSKLNRIVSIQRLINGQIDVLETMTPLDFLEFRDYLYPASGFQSFQWRKIETKLGLQLDQRVIFNDTPFYKSLEVSQQSEMLDVLKQPSLFTLIESWLERTPFVENKYFDFWAQYKIAVHKMFQQDKETMNSLDFLTEETKKRNNAMIDGQMKQFEMLFDEESYKKLQTEGHFRLSYKAIRAALFIQLYREQPALQIPHLLITKLLDIDEMMTQWRYRHSMMAHRMLGKKIGTGGSSGTDYLKSVPEKHKIFTDFFNLTTFFISRSKVPALPKELMKDLGYNF